MAGPANHPGDCAQTIRYGNENISTENKYLSGSHKEFTIHFLVDDRYKITMYKDNLKKRVDAIDTKIDKLFNMTKIDNISPKKISKFNSMIDKLELEKDSISKQIHDLTL